MYPFAITSLLPQVLHELLDRGDQGWSQATREALAGLAALEQALGYPFARRELLRTALTLGSWCNENRAGPWSSNACLEFFGDAVLGLTAADAVWRRFPDCAEGDLTRMRASLVSEAGLADVARQLQLGSWLYLGRGDEKRGARDHSGTLADSLEATLGAVFLDARHRGRDALGSVRSVFDRLFGPRVDALAPEAALDPKSRLQQRIQASFRATPFYVSLGERTDSEGEVGWGARIELTLASGAKRVLGEGHGRSLRAAEVEAAREALRRLDAGEFADGSVT
ncbi:MAG: ribonuclease III [Myxococcales bacterium FL481]|nr:MAG: ribonuclease III [Myxococcales bacterium FL481]